MRIPLKSVASALFALLACVSLARADTVVATLQSILPPLPVPLNQVSLDGQVYSTGIGAIQWSGASTNAAPYNGNFETFCIDLLDNIHPGTTYTYMTSSVANAPQNSAFPGFNGPMGPGKAAELGELFAQDFGATVGSSDASAAFQLAIWNIVYDSDDSVTTGSGDFFAIPNTTDETPTIIGLANTFLATLTPTPTTDTLQALVGQPMGLTPGTAGAQDQITINPFLTTGTSTPLPSAALGGGVLIAGLALTKLKRMAH